MGDAHWLKLGVCLCLANATGCTGGQTGEESLPALCQETNESVGLDERNSLGFSASEFEQHQTMGFVSPARFFQGDEIANITLDLGRASNAAVTHSSGDPTACTDRLDVEMAATLTSANGTFDERFPATVQARMLDLWSVSSDLPISQLKGSFDARSYDIGGWANPAIRLNARVERARFVGSIYLVDLADTPHTPSASQSTSAAVAEWPAP